MSVLSSAAGTVANVIKGNKNQAMLIVEDWRNVDRAASAAGGAAGGISGEKPTRFDDTGHPGARPGAFDLSARP